VWKILSTVIPINSAISPANEDYFRDYCENSRPVGSARKTRFLLRGRAVLALGCRRQSRFLWLRNRISGPRRFKKDWQPSKLTSNGGLVIRSNLSKNHTTRGQPPEWYNGSPDVRKGTPSFARDVRPIPLPKNSAGAKRSSPIGHLGSPELAKPLFDTLEWVRFPRKWHFGRWYLPHR
jgi:hypothetical protein